ncbi:MAG: cobalt-precorrin-5B (C(1))-methyltransferase, partial [Butyricicoccus sp.]
YNGGFSVTISVKDGEALAAQTYNGHLGIVGGISILGTSGIVEPMSEKALVDTIRLELDSLYAQGQRIAFLCPGNYGADFARDTLGLDLERAVKVTSSVKRSTMRRTAAIPRSCLSGAGKRSDGRRRDVSSSVADAQQEFSPRMRHVRRTARNRRADGCHLGGRVRGAAGQSELRRPSCRALAGDGNPSPCA